MTKKELLQGHYIKNLASKKQSLLKNLVIQIKNLLYIHKFMFEELSGERKFSNHMQEYASYL